jgi:hypothetical protein
MLLGTGTVQFLCQKVRIQVRILFLSGIRIRSDQLDGIPCRVFMFFLLNAGSDSPKKLGVEKGPAPNPPLGGGGGEAQLKYENDRLKLALAQSSANAKVSALHDTVHH